MYRFFIFLYAICNCVYAQDKLPECRGVEVNKWSACLGSTNSKNRERYSGEWVNGKREGNGQYHGEGIIKTTDIKFKYLTSFNCSISKLLADIAVCEDKKLAALDIENSNLFKKSISVNKVSTRSIQKISYSRKIGCNDNKTCIENVYLESMSAYLKIINSDVSAAKAPATEDFTKNVEPSKQSIIPKQESSTSSSLNVTVMANRKALVIGNDSYKFVSRLQNAREDARTIASNLNAVGYEVTLKLDLTEKEMKSALRTFSGQVQGGDEVMFYFAGHGVQLGATNYLLPTDIANESEEQVRDDAIQLQGILDQMSDKKAKFTLAMIDDCRDNPFKAVGRAVGGRGLAPTTAATGQMVVFSAGTGQKALDSLGGNDKNKNGVFTRTFVKEMQKSGLSIDRIIKNVRNEVAELAKSVGHEQVPAIYDQVLGDFYFKK